MIESLFGDDYTPVLLEINILVSFDGSYESDIADMHFVINNWTDPIQNFTIRVTITNPYNNTGSITGFWRIAEWRQERIRPLAWLIFFLQHGCVKPTISQPFMTPLKIEWSATDPEINVIDYTFGIIFNPDEECEMCLFVYIPPCTKEWSSIFHIPMTNVII